MPNRILVYSPLSRRDLDEIFDYISRELENPVAAHETVNAILDGSESLEGFPFVGSLVEGIPFLNEEYRFLTVRNYQQYVGMEERHGYYQYQSGT